MASYTCAKCGLTIYGFEPGKLISCECGAQLGFRDAQELLRARVATMRELGVLVWGDITLGPPPPTEATFEAAKVRTPEEERDEYERTLYASSE